MQVANLIVFSVENSPTTSSPCRLSAKGIQEIRVWDDAGAFRVIYTARLADAVYVLHAFQKTQVPPDDIIEIAKARFAELMRGLTKSPQADRFMSVWDAIADTPEEAANLRLRSELMDKI